MVGAPGRQQLSIHHPRTFPSIFPSVHIHTCRSGKLAGRGRKISAQRQIESKAGIMAGRLDPVPLICPTKALIEITAPETLDGRPVVNYRAQRLRRENGARWRTDNVSAKIDCWDERRNVALRPRWRWARRGRGFNSVSRDLRLLLSNQPVSAWEAFLSEISELNSEPMWPRPPSLGPWSEVLGKTSRWRKALTSS